MDLETLLCLGKYLFERKNNDTLERDFENKYAAENKDIKKKLVLLRISWVFIAHILTL
jgi:hypothetical protein